MTDDINYSYYHWGPLLCKFEVEHDNVDKLVSIGRKRHKNDYRSELAGHLDHEFEFNVKDRDLFVNWFGKYFNVYTQAYSERFGNDYGGLSLNSLWINFMKAGDFNPEHHHSDNVSFVLFCNDSKELKEEQEENMSNSLAPGMLVFRYGENSYKNLPEWNIRNHVIVPKKGDLYVFPALLSHYVAPFKSDIERISVSGNLSFRGTDDQTN
jgi:hypothetical protein